MRPAFFLLSFAATTIQALPQPASAQTRQFYCGEESFVAVETIDPTRLSAGPINGETLIFKQTAVASRFSSGKTTIEVSPDQSTIQIIPENGEAIGCVFPVPDDVVTPGGAAMIVQGQDAPGAKPTTDANTAQTAAESDQPESFAAKSWGGIVRDGPGMDYRKIGSLAEGDAITVIESSGVEMNGYTWFKIHYGADKTGFHWGGVICPIGKEMPGTFESCD